MAGKNANRTAAIVSGTTIATYCYDAADRVTSTTQSGYGTIIAYDSHGNTTTLGGETRRYDSADRHRETTSGSTTVSYIRDALDREAEPLCSRNSFVFQFWMTFVRC